MAADNEELTEITRQVAYELEQFGKISRSTADALRDAQVGVKGFSDAVRNAPKQVGTAAADLAKAMYKGEKGATAFNSSIDSMAQAADSASKILQAMIPGGPIVKALFMGMRLLIKGVAEGTKVVNQQSDSLYKSFQSLAQSGVAVSGGTTKLGQDFYKLGISVYDADKMLSMFAESSQDLALFGKTAFQGADAFTDIVNASKPYRAELERLGLNQHEQNEAMLQYIKTQTRMGNANKIMALGAEGAAAAANKYIDEQDALTKLLGVSRKEQQKAIDDAMRNARYAASIDELQDNAGEEAADQLNMITSIVGKVFGEDLNKAVQDWTTGLPGATEEARKGIVSGGQEMFELIQRIRAGEFKGKDRSELIKAFQEASKPINAMTDATRRTTQNLGDANAFLSYSTRRNLKMYTENNTKLSEEFKKAEDQVKRQRSGEDKRLANQSETVVAQEDATLAAQLLVDKGIDPAAAAMAQVSKAALAAANALNKIAGVKTPGASGAIPTGAAPTTAAALGTERAKKAKEAVDAEQAIITARQQQKTELDATLVQLKKDKDDAFKSGKSNEEIAKIDASIAETEKKRLEIQREVVQRSDALKKLQTEANVATKQQNSQVADYNAARQEVTRLEEQVALARKAQYELETGQNKEYNAVKGKNVKRENEIRDKILKDLEEAQGKLSKAKEMVEETGKKVGAETGFKGDSKEFYNKMYTTLLEQAKKQGVANPEAIARLGAAQSSLETGYGKSTAGGNNYFGIKGKAGDPNVSSVDTQEYDPSTGKYKTIKAGFRKYASMEESAADYVKFLQENQRYQGVLAAQTAQQAIEAQGRTGYATDPQYAQKLAAIHAKETKAAGGAIISGPLDGYKPNITAHGTEAIIPIKDGSIPVKMSDSFTSSVQSSAEIAQQNIGLSEAILASLNEMIKQQKETNAISQKILRVSQ